MYLHVLSDEEKEDYLKVVTYAMNVDYDIKISEENLIRMQCNEMGIKYHPVDLRKFDLQEALDKFSSNVSRKVLFLEIVTVMLMDGDLEMHEKRLLDQIKRHYGFDTEFTAQVIEYARQFATTFFRCRELIYGRNSIQ